MMQAHRVENKENTAVANALQAEVAPAVSKQPFGGNLMILTQNARTRVEDRKNAEGAIKPENDPFWNDRCAEKDARLAANPASAAIRAHAVSKLLQPTSAYLSGARKKVDEEVAQKAIEDKAKATVAQRVPVIPAECGLLRPTTAYRQHKTTAPEPSEPSDETVARTLNEFGNVKTFNRRAHGGTIGFGLASDVALPVASGTMELPGQAPKKELTQPVVSQRLLVATSASRAATYASHKEETVKKFRTWTTPVKRPAQVAEAVSQRVANLAAPVYRLTAQAEALRTESLAAAPAAPLVPRERGWNGMTCNAKSLDTAYVRTDSAQQVPITGAVAPLRTTFTPTVFHAFSVADKPTAAAAMRSRGGVGASVVAEQLLAANEKSLALQKSMHRASSTSRASLGGFSSVMRPTAASTSNVSNRRNSMLPAPPAPMAMQMQAVRAKPEMVAQVMPPAPPVEIPAEKAVIKVESQKAPVAPVASAVEIKAEEEKTAIPMVDGDELVMTAEEASLYADIVASTMASLTASRATRMSKSPKMKRTPIKSPKSESVKKSTPKAGQSLKAAAISVAKRTPLKCTVTPGKSPAIKSAKKSPSSTSKSPKTPKSSAKKGSPRSSPTGNSTPKMTAKTPKSARKTIMSTPVAVPSPPSPLSAPASAPHTATRMSAAKSANKSKIDLSSAVASLTQDVADLLVDSPHVSRSASGVAITPPTRGQVPAFDESPLTPAEIKRSSRRVTRSLAAHSVDEA